jgi:hypothetical protein
MGPDLENMVDVGRCYIQRMPVSMLFVNTLRTGDADLRLYAYEQFKYPVPNVLSCAFLQCRWATEPGVSVFHGAVAGFCNEDT